MPENDYTLRRIAAALRAAADELDKGGTFFDEPKDPDDSPAEAHNPENVLLRLKGKFGYEPFDVMAKGSPASKCAKVNKLYLKEILYQAKEKGLINEVGEHIWQFPRPWMPEASDGSGQLNVYQILLAVFGRKAFTVKEAITAFKGGSFERVIPLLSELEREQLAREISDELWILEK